MQRREFIGDACKGACGLVLGAGLLSMFGGCSTVKVYKATPTNGKVSIDPTQFDENGLLTLRVPSLDNDILVARKSGGGYTAVLMRCTHQDWDLIATGKGLQCTLHGSRFDLDGKVTKGPAAHPLQNYVVHESDGRLTIEL